MIFSNCPVSISTPGGRANTTFLMLAAGCPGSRSTWIRSGGLSSSMLLKPSNFVFASVRMTTFLSLTPIWTVPACFETVWMRPLTVSARRTWLNARDAHSTISSKRIFIFIPPAIIN